MNICITTKACSFGKTIVEKIEVRINKKFLLYQTVIEYVEWYNEI
jgi:hypothetical protein